MQINRAPIKAYRNLWVTSMVLKNTYRSNIQPMVCNKCLQLVRRRLTKKLLTECCATNHFDPQRVPILINESLQICCKSGHDPQRMAGCASWGYDSWTPDMTHKEWLCFDPEGTIHEHQTWPTKNGCASTLRIRFMITIEHLSKPKEHHHI